MRYVVELFLPLARGDGLPVPMAEVEGIIAGLAERFGGATAFTRDPAEGLWKDADEVERDRIIVVEVMVDQLDEPWWRDFRTRLEQDFQQEKILVRATLCQTL